MKKLVIMMAILSLFTVSAMAQVGRGGGGMGQGQGQSFGGFSGPGFDSGVLVNNADEAKRLVDGYIKAKNMSNYTVSSVVPVQVPMGTAYYVYVVDGANNDFTFMVGMHGVIHGPAVGQIEAL